MSETGSRTPAAGVTLIPVKISGLTYWATPAQAEYLQAGSRIVEQAWAEVESALPTKRYTVTLTGDWEDGWIATAEGSFAGGEKPWRVTTEGQGWGADRGGVPTPAAALDCLRAALDRLT